MAARWLFIFQALRIYPIQPHPQDCLQWCYNIELLQTPPAFFFFLGRLVWGLLYFITAHDFWSFIHVLCLGVTDSQRLRKNDNKCCFHSQYKTLPKGSVICNGKFLLLKILHKQIRHFILNINQWVNLIIHTANPKSEWQQPQLSTTLSTELSHLNGGLPS